MTVKNDIVTSLTRIVMASGEWLGREARDTVSDRYRIDLIEHLEANLKYIKAQVKESN